jgi:hypothetical protein
MKHLDKKTIYILRAQGCTPRRIRMAAHLTRRLLSGPYRTKRCASFAVHIPKSPRHPCCWRARIELESSSERRCGIPKGEEFVHDLPLCVKGCTWVPNGDGQEGGYLWLTPGGCQKRRPTRYTSGPFRRIKETRISARCAARSADCWLPRIPPAPDWRPYKRSGGHRY